MRANLKILALTVSATIFSGSMADAGSGAYRGPRAMNTPQFRSHNGGGNGGMGMHAPSFQAQRAIPVIPTVPKAPSLNIPSFKTSAIPSVQTLTHVYVPRRPVAPVAPAFSSAPVAPSLAPLLGN